MEKKINGHLLTTDEEMDSILPGDSSVEVTGVITQLDPPTYTRRRSSNNSYTTKTNKRKTDEEDHKNDNQPFRCIFSNMSGRQLRILFWQEKKKEYEGSILKQVVRISRPQVVIANPAFNFGREDLMKIEFSIQRTTTVHLLGAMPKEHEEIEFKRIEFKNVPFCIGKQISIEGYVRSAIIVQSSGNSSYGNGSVTDTYYRLPIFVTKFNHDIEEGTHVELRGRLRVNEQNTIILQVPDAEHITKVDSSLATWEFMKLGFHPLLLPTTAENEITVQPNSSESDSHNKKPSSPEEHATTPSKISKKGDDKGDDQFDDLDLGSL